MKFDSMKMSYEMDDLMIAERYKQVIEDAYKKIATTDEFFESFKENFIEGLKEGIEKVQKKIIVSLYKSGLSVEEISKRTQLLENEINDFLKDIKELLI